MRWTTLTPLMLLVAATQSPADDSLRYAAEFVFPPEQFHNHSSSIVETAAGDLLVCWFHGKAERTDDTLVIQGARRKKGESRWSPPFVMADNQDLPDQNCTLFIDSDDRLWLFWTSSIDNLVRSFFVKYRYSTDYDGDGAPIWTWQDALFCRPKDAETAFPELLKNRLERVERSATLTEEWKAAFLAHAEERQAMYSDKLFQRLGWLPRQPPIMLSEKRMMLGLYSDTFDCSMFAFTEDAGRTWEFSRPLEQFGIQPSIVRRKNGDLVAYLRSEPLTGCVESRDGGMTWEERPLSVANTGSSIAVLALKSGQWVMAVNDDLSGRHQLSLYLSEDEGMSWHRKRFLEKLDPTEGRTTSSYPTMIQTADGMIHVTYTYENEPEFSGKTIKHAWFSEAWIRAGRDLVP